MKMMFLSRADIEKVLDMKSTINRSGGRRSGRSSHTISTTRTASWT